MYRRILVLGATMALTVGAAAPRSSAAETIEPVRAVTCDRACLYGFLDKYLDALVAKDPSRLPLAEHARFSENSVEMQVGDGLWNTITGRGDYDLRLADTKTGNVGWYGVVYEHGNAAAIALRIKVRDGLITQVESVLSRQVGNGPFPNPQPQLLTKLPIFDRIEPIDTRRPRARLLSIADGYFDTLQLNDGTIFTQFDKDCNRRENGFQTTNNKNPGIPGAVLSLGCEAQFKTGNFRFDDRLRARRFPVIDEERGLVMAGGFIDHSGKLQQVTLTDGRVIKSIFKTPHSYCLLELFKIVDGKIRQVEAVFTDVPYNMPSPWFHPHGNHQ
jgi:hypothetical protein